MKHTVKIPLELVRLCERQQYPERSTVTRLAFEVLNRTSIDQYVAEERAQMARRAKVEGGRLRALLGVMRREEIAPHSHVAALARELDRMHGTHEFASCETMGELAASHILKILELDPNGPSWDL